LKNAIKKTFNYEDLYEDVLRSSQFSNDEKDLFFKAVLGAYEALDDVIRELSQQFFSSDVFDLNKLRKFLERLSGGPKEKGFFFTLNQDLFIERYCYQGDIGPSLPGLKAINQSQRFTIKDSRPLKKIGHIKIAQNEGIDYHEIEFKDLSKLFYVKLHGSYDWRDDENQEILIIGTKKPSQISSNPILTWYFNLFNAVLSIPNRKLMVIGYGFKDEHINEAIAKAVKNSNLKIFILSPQDPESFLHNTLGFNQCARDNIWKAVYGYYQITPKEIFSKKSKHTSLTNSLFKNYFE